MRKKIIIMGAAGRDFHNFNVLYKDNPEFEVKAFTASQIPFISNRSYPPSLSGKLYPEGIPIYPENKLAGLIRKYEIDQIVFSYSDISYKDLMPLASLCVAEGADFILPGSEKTMLKAKKPVISSCAVRTGCGKSGITKFIARVIRDSGKKPVIIRHPMAYGDLEKQRVQRFEDLHGLQEALCTIEEMEEYEHLVEAGFVVYAGVDYKEILERAQEEADILVWDGGNNDLPFIKPDFEVVATDPLRPGHELLYFPGEANLLRADCVVINKVNSATAENIDAVFRNIKLKNPKATVVKTDSKITFEGNIAGKKALVIEDGPTLTHGGMPFGAGFIAAKNGGATPVDPRPYAIGSIKKIYEDYPDLKELLPAMGYSEAQKKELQESINATPCDMVLIATPVDLSRAIKINKPHIRVYYEIRDTGMPGLKGAVEDFLKGL